MIKGLGDIGNIMKQAQALQERMGELQAELERMDCEGKSGGGLVSVTLNGKGEMKLVSIDPSLMRAEDAEILEDLIVAAHNDAKAKLEEAVQEKMRALSGGLPLPPGMKLF